jgi:molybdopterin-synthase adenylyltransferase
MVSLASSELFEHLEIRSNEASHSGLPHILAEKTIESHRCEFSISFDRAFPSSLPKFKLLNVTAFQLMANVDAQGTICLFEKDTVLVNPHDPFGIIRDCAERAFLVIRKGVSTSDTSDIFLELEAFLRLIPKYTNGISLIEMTDTPKFVHWVGIGNQRWFFENRSQINAFGPALKVDINSRHLQKGRALFVPLNDSERQLLPKFGWRKWWSSTILRIVFRAAIKRHGFNCLSLLAKTTNSTIPIVFKLPLTDESFILFGADLSASRSGTHPIIKIGTNESCVPIILNRMDKGYLLPRGGASTDVTSKSILLVGCGSVGSCIAQDLLKSGVGKLTLLDMDDLKPENAYRHHLGMDDCLSYRKKTDLLKSRLEQASPHSVIESVTDDFVSVIQGNKEDFSKYDVVVLATGNDNLNLLASEYFSNHFPALPVLFTWLDPLGIGGHVLTTNLETRGCYRCLFGNKKNGESSLYNKASLAQEGQSFSKTMAGCGGRFTEFSFLDVQQTALVATRQILDVLRGKSTKNQLTSWKGSDEKFKEQGFKTSHRYTTASDNERFFDFGDDDCPICGDAARRRDIPKLS